MDLDIMTARPERERDCPACQWTWADEFDQPEHSCRSKPSIPRTTLQDRARASARIHLARELRIRNETLADRGRANG